MLLSHLKYNNAFAYDAIGNRIAKHVFSTNGTTLERSTYYILDAQGNQISTYDHEIVSETAQFNLKERNIYGSSRIGSKQDSLNVLTATITKNYSQTLGNKYFEFSNHLGNVLTVFSDLKIPKDTDNNNVVDEYEIGMVSTADYSPFGVELDGRTDSAQSYRYGFNGMEADDEVKGSGNSYTTEFRQYDARVGRWLSLDPLMGKFPWQSPYVAFDNNPLYYTDPNGGASKPNWLPFLLSAIEGAVVGGASEYVFQVADAMIFGGQSINKAMSSVDWTDVGVEAGIGAASNVASFNGYAAAKIATLFSGKYRKTSMYLIKQGLGLLESTINDVSKDYFNGEVIDLNATFRNVLGDALFSEVMNSNPFVDKGLKKAGRTINDKVDKARDINSRIKSAQKELSQVTNPKEKVKLEKHISKMQRNLSNTENKATKLLAKEYSKLSGQYGDKVTERAKGVIYGKIRANITVEPTEQQTIEK
jgi:RHS repeat-associated protein